MLVYVLNSDNTPLMPCKPARARHLLRDGEAVIARRNPFTIRLVNYIANAQIQPVTVGVDLGAKTVGVAAVSNGRVLYQGEVILRSDIRWRMDRRRAYRRTRRARKLRYRPPRFNNRANSRRKGRLPPTIRSKSDTTSKVVRRITSLLPVSHIRIEVADFDTQAMRANRPCLPNWAYQRGELYQEENIKAYVRKRDRYTCQYCGTISPPDLEVDHIIPRSRGGTMCLDNLIVSCHSCNSRKGEKTATEFGHPNIQKRTKKSLKAAAHTQIGKNYTLRMLSLIAPVDVTWGYVTKADRMALGLPKTHYNDAVAIANGSEGSVETLLVYETMRAVSKGAYRQRRGAHSQRVARLPYEVFGFRQWDKVQLPSGLIGFIAGRRRTGYFMIKSVDGTVIKDSVPHRKLQLLERASTLLTEQRYVPRWT